MVVAMIAPHLRFGGGGGSGWGTRRAIGGGRGSERDLVGARGHDRGRRGHHRATALEAEQVCAQVVGGLVPAHVDALGHRGEDDRLEHRRDVRVASTAASAAPRARADRDHDRAFTGERRDAGDHLVEDDAERVHVGRPSTVKPCACSGEK